MRKTIILSQDEINPVKWSELVRECGGSIFNTFEYISLCNEAWEALVIVENDRYVCATPIHFRIKSRIKYIYQSPFIPYYEILNSGGQELLLIFKDELIKYLGRYKYIAKYFLIDTNLLEHGKLQTTQEKCYRLSLSSNYEHIAKSYSRDRKYRLNQAIKSGQEIIHTRDIDSFFDNLESFTLSKIENFETAQKLTLRNLYKELSKKYHLEILVSKKENNVYAGVLYIKHLGGIYYLESFSSEEGRKHNGTTLLLDHIIRTNVESEYEFIDLGLKGTPGIEAFKKSFGAMDHDVMQVYRNALPWYIKVFKAVLNYWGIATSKL